MDVTVNVWKSVLEAIESFYGNQESETVDTVVNDIVTRYLNTEHFDPELITDSES